MSRFSRDIFQPHERAASAGLAIDWRACYKAFEAGHGEPVIDGGRLVFADGWTHALAYRGPIWPPPKDQNALRALKLVHWRRRREVLSMRFHQLQSLLQGIESEARARGGPIQLVQTFRGEHGIERRQLTSADLDDQHQTLIFLKADIDEADEKVKELEDARPAGVE